VTRTPSPIKQPSWVSSSPHPLPSRSTMPRCWPRLRNWPVSSRPRWLLGPSSTKQSGCCADVRAAPQRRPSHGYGSSARQSTPRSSSWPSDWSTSRPQS